MGKPKCSTSNVRVGNGTMTIFAEFDEDGKPLGFWDAHFISDTSVIPDDVVEITAEQRDELLATPATRRWQNGKVVEIAPPAAPPSVLIVPAVTLWERLTESEAEQVNAAMATQPFRTRQIFLTANTFRSDHELWPLLVRMTNELFGEIRGSELLAN